MELHKEISAEQLPKRRDSGASTSKSSHIQIPPSIDVRNLSEEEVTEQIETILLERIKDGDKLALFQLGHLYFEQGDFVKSKKYFERSAEKGDFQSKFQLGVICYDGLDGEPDHKAGFDYMKDVAESTTKRSKHLLRAAQYNLGRAYFQGYGVRQSDNESERLWLLAADDGNPNASVKAQSMLGMFYSRPDNSDLKKAFFWHSEACGNGSLESQGALGIMYLHGVGCKKDANSAFICLREAAERGNVYAMGHLIAYYYRSKLYTKTIELAARVAQMEDVAERAEDTDCLPGFIAKGISLGSFYYARCLHQGLGVKKDEDEAKKYYSKSYQYDPDTCATLQNLTQQGVI